MSNSRVYCINKLAIISFYYCTLSELVWKFNITRIIKTNTVVGNAIAMPYLFYLVFSWSTRRILFTWWEMCQLIFFTNYKHKLLFQVFTCFLLSFFYLSFLFKYRNICQNIQYLCLTKYNQDSMDAYKINSVKETLRNDVILNEYLITF